VWWMGGWLYRIEFGGVDGWLALYRALGIKIGPTHFQQFLEATDQDTLIDQSLTVIVEAIP